MSGETPQLLDTIAAIATAPGRSGVALLRVSGSLAHQILLRLAPSLAGECPPPRRQVLLPLVHPETRQLLDRALVARFVAPHSYTGEDTVEIGCHGGDLTPRLILDATLAAGARLAFPGEFTRRAYLNGRMDLVQAEAVADLIDARSPAMHQAAVHQMERGLSVRLEGLRTAILQAEALAAYWIDFPEEDEPPVPLSRVREAAEEVLDRIQLILSTAPEGVMLREGPLVVLAGRPNSGKSSLFNALLGLERAIVTDVPGTTRDAIEADALLDGFPFRLVDTAGLRSTDDRVEKIGIEVAQRYLGAADLVLFCSDAEADLAEDEKSFLERLSSKPIVLVRTKADSRAAGHGPTSGDPAELLLQAIDVSVVTGAGLSTLRERMVGVAFGRIREVGEEPVITRERHARALRRSAEEIGLFLHALRTDVPLAVAATHLRAAAGAIEDVIGVVTPDDVLGAIFGQFCVGK